MTTKKEAEKSFRTKRLMKELKDITENSPPLITAQIKGGDMSRWIATIQGPPGTPYEEGKFKLSLKFPPGYPFNYPDVRFITKIYHANISDSGGICLDILGSKWCPTMTVRTLLLSISSLLADCNPNSPLRGDIATLYKKDRKQHDRNAREYTRKYAM